MHISDKINTIKLTLTEETVQRVIKRYLEIQGWHVDSIEVIGENLDTEIIAQCREIYD